ncbi:prepilin-type N-terminal cleavage/methylation domain-containing protein [Candidatus Wolfebacteria bacterium]|nr:prepilin-type N-terminal cleavage/methylation domain-containing protein [Candidatus Wolfebacteria bacterium]
MKSFNKKKGFTLIEVIIYAALVSLMAEFSIFSMNQIINNNNFLRAKIEVEEETNFILQKINWALGNAGAINQPGAGATSTILSVNKNNFSQNPIVFDLNGNNVRLSKGGINFSALNNQNVSVNRLIFEHLAASGSAPAAVKTTIAVNSKSLNYSKTIEILYYLRQ